MRWSNRRTLHESGIEQEEEGIEEFHTKLNN
jgi:hypothetical protein